MDTDLTGLCGITLAIVALLARMPRVQALPMQKRAGLLLGALLVVTVPLWGVSLAGLVRGITGDLSIATLILLVLALVRVFSERAKLESGNRDLALRAIAIGALLFYPFALGFSMFDPYRLGYGNVWFMLVLLGLAVWSVLRYSSFLGVCIAAGVAAWSLGWYESTNLWDYLLDPWLAVYALGVTGRNLLQRLMGGRHV